MESFAVRLRDILSTLEAAALLGSSSVRVRGLGEQLMFACAALPCDEALVALELGRLGRLSVPGVASADGWRPCDVQFLPSGTPLAYLLGGGTGYAAEVEPDDPLLEALQEALAGVPRYAVFVPIRVGAGVLGGAVLLRADRSFGDAELTMAERLAEVLALTVESFRTERVLLQLFAEVLPDLCAPDAPTRFAEGLAAYIHRLRLSPTYRDRLLLADAVARLAAHGSAETRLIGDVLGRFERYVRELSGATSDEPDAGAYDDLYEV